MFNPQALYEFVCHQWDEEIIPSLCDYIKIPNKSPHFDPKWQEHGLMDKAVSHIADWCKAHAPKGMMLDIMKLEGRTPLIFIEVPGEIDETVLLYGHLDKQPEMSGWSEDLHPWQPVLKNGRLYGRGAADDGYSAYASLTAICALQNQGLPIPRCVLIIEACEESGSYDLPFYIEQLKDRIGKPKLVICLDSGAGNYEQLWMTTSLRGNLVGELSVELIQEGVHSGAASGIVADSFRVARQLISRIEDEVSGEVKLSELYCDIPEERIKQAGQCAEVLGDSVYVEFPLHEGVDPITKDRVQLILNRTWRPALTVTGADGFPAIENAGNVLRPQTALKLSMRLPPLVDPKSAATVMHDVLTKEPPYHAKVSFNVGDGSQGWNAPPLSSWLEKAADAASMAYYGKPAAYLGEGGTIPFMGMLGKKFPEAQFMITGVLGPQSNAHGPNEFLHLDMVRKLTASVAYVLYHVS
ncbi:M20 family metallopeptidase [Fluoribacter gormanii]|uniref:Acetylornithine deacetylase/Succinyl-diaminopimelate desuccinylase n=1 Tax=Fluoribacter gormanii TaxID=464 RepID=A0A377GKB0_9GAMM|nr:M20 family metallopeptidase [Fluoribacter gormanii]KTD02574.1 succinyl-diaminopimelate desuccinylase [Fluoribacter gormanii]MCW8443205.1 M20 family metallopeptidase [Fluoribacter gormanii]MCW8471628.1 M20 family metallopeptidase [Fluoribacter gormanii]SIR42914.1 Acetylornithine deacetylase/Succinyl-diaminopimelate desuccinylase [Fluoribacter gormanii]STO25259.1 putative dipeptidase [Fluoribacter gormanii]